MNNKLLIICGPTATGKTKLAVELAKKFNGELISADSRQVYMGLDIGTGKDLKILKNTKIHGLNLVNPDEKFSVADYQKFAHQKISEIHKKNKLPILVGGTGLYIKAIANNLETTTIPQNKKLRDELSNKSSSELFDLLISLDPKKASSLNNSDKNNPRRLIRAIEISKSNQTISNKSKNYNVLAVCLTASKKTLAINIKKRVDQRIQNNFLEEIKNLLRKGVKWSDQSMSSLGYKQLKNYFDKKLSLDEAVTDWKKAEIKYAKRQLTWFKAQPNINWFDISKSNWQKDVEHLVHKWYDKS